MFAAKHSFYNGRIPGGIVSGPAGLSWGNTARLSYDGQYMAVGVRTYSGSPQLVSVLARNSTPNDWTIQASLTSPVDQNLWGLQVDINGDGSQILVGAPSNTPSSIDRFIRTGSTWSFTQGITAGGVAYLGAASCISGDGTLIAGGSIFTNNTAFYDASGNFMYLAGGLGSTTLRLDQTGQRLLLENQSITGNLVRIFVRSGTGSTATWAQEYDIAANTPTTIGPYSVAINSGGDWAIVGSPVASGNFGRAYIFQRVGSVWALVQTLQSPTPVANEKFGLSVDINGTGTRAVVGTDLNATSVNSSAYVFNRSGASWGVGTLLSKPISAIGRFGFMVSIAQTASDYIAVTDTVASQVFVYHWTGSTWTLGNQ